MSIAENRRARFEYHIEERYEAGMVLSGWEIKAIRAGQVQLTDGYVVDPRRRAVADRLPHQPAAAAPRRTSSPRPTGPRSC